MNGDFFEAIVQLPEAYNHLSTAEAESHYRAAQSLFEASIPFLERLPHLRSQPASLGKWNFPGRIKFLDDHACQFLEDS
jgi:hypothetical protein